MAGNNDELEEQQELSCEALQNELDEIDVAQATEKIERPKLTDMQELFCHEYMIDFNATQSALRAGYKPTTRMSSNNLGARLKKLLKWRIEELMAERIQKTDVEAEWVVRELVDVVKKCREYTPVLDFKGKQVIRETEDGKMFAAYDFNAKGATAALDLLGKHLGMYKEKVEVTMDESYAAIMKAARERVEKANAAKDSSDETP
jgi:phage terminase small subunit